MILNFWVFHLTCQYFINNFYNDSHEWPWSLLCVLLSHQHYVSFCKWTPRFIFLLSFPLLHNSLNGIRSVRNVIPKPCPHFRSSRCFRFPSFWGIWGIVTTPWTCFRAMKDVFVLFVLFCFGFGLFYSFTEVQLTSYKKPHRVNVHNLLSLDVCVNPQYNHHY